MFKSENPALVIIDVQKAIDDYSESQRNNLDAESNISILLSLWRSSNLPIVHVRHSSKLEASPYHKLSSAYGFKPEVMPQQDESIITKTENCAFINTNLETLLRAQEIQEVVICGVLTNNSIDATVRVAAGLGFDVFLPSDATAAFGLEALNGRNYSAEDVHWIFLSNLHCEYCTVVTVQQLRE